jgi:hypothetical protein
MSLLKMPHINQVAISGRLVQEPELLSGENGTPGRQPQLSRPQ